MCNSNPGAEGEEEESVQNILLQYDGISKTSYRRKDKGRDGGDKKTGKKT